MLVALAPNVKAKAVTVVPGSLLNRKHERVRMRTTGQCRVDAVAGDQSTPTSTSVTSQSAAQLFLWEAGALALASQAQETSIERGLPRMRDGRKTQF